MKVEEPPMIGVPKSALPHQEAPKDEFQLSFQNIVVVSECPDELMGEPSQPIPPNELNNMATEEIEFSPFNEVEYLHN